MLDLSNTKPGKITGGHMLARALRDKGVDRGFAADSSTPFAWAAWTTALKSTARAMRLKPAFSPSQPRVARAKWTAP